MESLEKDNTCETTITGKDLIDFIKFSIENHVETMKAFLKNETEEFSMIFQIITSDMKIIIFPPAITNIPKELAADFARSLAKRYNAVAVIHVTECWTLTNIKSREEMDIELEKYGSISNHPDRIECFNVMASYNIRGKGVCEVYSAPILHITDGIRMLDEENAKRNVFEDVKGNMTIPSEYLIPIEI